MMENVYTTDGYVMVIMIALDQKMRLTVLRVRVVRIFMNKLIR